MILTSSRASAGAFDELSDYDVELAVTDAEAFVADDAWARAYGPPLARWGDESDLFGATRYFLGVVYEDGVKVDYSVWPAALVERIGAASRLLDRFDVGYRVLLDKDGGTASWPPPSYRAHIPAPPTADEYRALVEEFWWSATYAAKALWRGEIVFAKFVLDYELKLAILRRLLEWRIELVHDWSLKPGAYGRGLERLLPPDLWAELAQTWVGVDPAENWAALERLVTLFRRVATEVADALGFAYPHDVDEKMVAHLEAVRARPPAVP